MLYALIKTLLRPGLKLAYKFSVRGAGRVPKSGPVLIVANHTSYLDPLILGVASPRKIFFMAKEELFKIPVLKSVITRLGSFPVRRNAFDRQAISVAINKLKSGQVVGIFPQGGRRWDGVNDGFPGAALIAYKSGAVIVPAGIKGADQIMPGGSKRPRFPRVTVSFGEPLRLDLSGHKKEVIARATDQILQEIRSLLGKTAP